MWRQILQVIRKNVPGRIFPKPQEFEARLVTVTKEIVPRPSATSFAFSQAKHFFFNCSKISMVSDLVENFKSERICHKISASKNFGCGTLSIVRTNKKGMSQMQEIKTSSRKNECNGVNIGVVTKFKLRYSNVKFLQVLFNQLSGLHPPLTLINLSLNLKTKSTT